MTDFEDSATIPGVTTPTSVDTYQAVDAATTPSKTAPSSSELSDYIETATVACQMVVSSIEAADNIDTNTIAGITSLSMFEAWSIRLTTTDYFNEIITTDVAFDTSYPVAGSVGSNDTDNGLLT